MYAHADMGARKGKPCDGIRYNVFHKENDLMRHQLDLDVFRPTIEHKDPQQYSGNTPANKGHNGGGGRPCGGKFYGIYHTPAKATTEEKKETIKQSTIDAKVADSGHGAMHDTRAYSSDDASLAAAAQTAQSSYAARQHDMSSVDNAVNFNFDARRYSRIEPDMRTMHYAVQQVSPSALVREYAGSETKKEYSKYEKKYEGSIKKYSGRDIKAAESAIKEAKKETEKEGLKESKLRKKILRKKQKPELKAKETRKTDKKIKKLSKEKQIKTKKADKNDIHRRALPSGPEAVRKRPAPGNRKGR